jgi:hypothetical protein
MGRRHGLAAYPGVTVCTDGDGKGARDLRVAGVADELELERQGARGWVGHQGARGASRWPPEDVGAWGVELLSFRNEGAET